MRFAIFGTGGVGGYFGGRLAHAGEDVVFIARGDHLKAMTAHGLRVDSVNGDFAVDPVQATDDPGQVGIADVVLVGVKAWQVLHAAESIRPMIGRDTTVLPLQNGLEAAAQLAEVLGERHVLGGLCGLMSYIAEPGRICHAGVEPFIRFGEIDNSPSLRVEKLREAFARAGVAAEVPPDIQVALWMKFLFMTPFSGLGSMTRAPVGVWRSLPETRSMAEEALREIKTLAETRRVPLPEDAVHAIMGMYDNLPPMTTTSMQRDVMAGRPSELEAQIGVVVRFGKEADLATPLHRFFYGSLLPMELRVRDQLQFPE